MEMRQIHKGKKTLINSHLHFQYDKDQLNLENNYFVLFLIDEPPDDEGPAGGGLGGAGPHGRKGQPVMWILQSF